MGRSTDEKWFTRQWQYVEVRAKDMQHSLIIEAKQKKLLASMKSIDHSSEVRKVKGKAL